jgi:hypothetical protein
MWLIFVIIMWLLFPLIFFNRVTYFSFFPWFFQSCDLIGDNCIVFENFTASIGDLMAANWVYWRCESVACKRIFATITIQYSYLHSNVIMGIDLQTVLPHYWQDDVSSNQLKF